MEEHIVVRIFTKICDLILLNVLWVMCSIPVFTAGASTTALYTVTLRMVSNEEGYITKDFFRAFKENFRQSTVVWIIFIVLGMILRLDVRIVDGVGGTLGIVGKLLFTLVSIVYFLEVLFVFPVIARFENTIENHMKNTLRIYMSQLPKALIIALLSSLCIIVTQWTKQTMLFGGLIWLTFGVATLSFANSYILRNIFDKIVS